MVATSTDQYLVGELGEDRFIKLYGPADLIGDAGSQVKIVTIFHLSMDQIESVPFDLLVHTAKQGIKSLRRILPADNTWHRIPVSADVLPILSDGVLIGKHIRLEIRINLKYAPPKLDKS